MEQGAAGDPPAGDRGRLDHVDRRDHREPVPQPRQAAAVPVPPPGSSRWSRGDPRAARARGRGRRARDGRSASRSPTTRSTTSSSSPAGDARAALTALEAAVLLADAARPSTATASRTPCRSGSSPTTAARTTSTSSPRSSRACAAPTRTRRCSGSGDDPRGRGPAVHRPADGDLRVRGRGSPTRRRSPSRSRRRTRSSTWMPEARLNLAEAALYLARAPKSNSASTRSTRRWSMRTPPTRSRRTPGAAKLGHGEGYEYPHDFEGHHVEQAYRPERFEDAVYYEPSGQGARSRSSPAPACRSRPTRTEPPPKTERRMLGRGPARSLPGHPNGSTDGEVTDDAPTSPAARPRRSCWPHSGRSWSCSCASCS